MKVLVLGSEGVIGSSLVRELEHQKHEVLKWDIKLSDTHDLKNPENNELLNKTIQDSDFIFLFAISILRCLVQ